MASTDLATVKPPTTELGTAAPPGGGLPTWFGLSGSTFGRAGAYAYVDDRPGQLPELRWPFNVRFTFPRMALDTQLKALERGTILPLTRYAWGIDENGADPALVAGVCADYNLPLIDDAIAERTTGRPANPVPRAKARFSFAKHQEQALKAVRTAHQYFEAVGEIGADGLWHPTKLGQLPPRTLESIVVAEDGGLVGVRQFGISRKPIPVTALVAYVWDAEDRGDWVGTSMYEACYREWLLKDRLLRIDLINHDRGGGFLVAEAPKDSRPADVERLDAMMQAARAGERSGGAVASGTKIAAYGSAGSDRIASINRHDEAMARAWLLMAIQLGSTQTGSRAVGTVQQDLQGDFAEGIAIWFRDVFNEHVIEDYADWNYDAPNLVPRLIFARPERIQPADSSLAGQGVTLDPATQAALAGASPRTVGRLRAAYERENREYRGRLARVLPALLTEEELEYVGDLVGQDERQQDELHAALSDGLVRPTRGKPAARAAQTGFRRAPTATEVRAAIDFTAVDQAWTGAVDQLVASWKAIRAMQIAELHEKIVAANGDLEALAQLEATRMGADVVAARLTQMAHAAAAEAVAEAARQGMTAALPDLSSLTGEITARAGAVEQLLTSALAGAASAKAVQATGGSLDAAEVGALVRTYLEGLSDAYLHDQLGGAISAAQTSGRLAAMDHNGASRYYISALLDASVCAPCAADDGREFDSAEAVAEVMPAGGNVSCQGGPRCRCSAIAVYDEAAPSA